MRNGWWIPSTPMSRLIRLVLDNLNTHPMASLYETRVPGLRGPAHCQPAGVPPHPLTEAGLDIAEIEFSVLARARLRGRNALMRTAWAKSRQRLQCPERNAIGATLNWRFTAHDARRKDAKTPDANSIASIPANPDLVHVVLNQSQGEMRSGMG